MAYIDNYTCAINKQVKITKSIFDFLTDNNLDSTFVFNSFDSYYFKNHQYLFEHYNDINIENGGIDKVFKMSEYLQKCFDNDKHFNLNVHSKFFNDKNPLFRPLRFLNSTINEKLNVHSMSKSLYINIFLFYNEKEKASKLNEELENILKNHLKNSNLQICDKDFIINLYLPANSIGEITNVIDFSLIKFKKVIEYNYNEEVIKIFRAFGIIKSFSKKLNHLIITDKLENIIYNDVYDIEILINCLTKKNEKLINEGFVNKSFEINKTEFEKLNQTIDSLLRNCKTKSSFETNSNNVKIVFRQETISQNGNFSIKYFIDEITDKSAVFFNSYFHKHFYNILQSTLKNYSLLSNPKIFKRFKSDDKYFLNAARKIFRQKLNNSGISDKTTIVKNRWNYSIGMIENSYKIYNKTSLNILPSEIEKLEEYHNMRNEIKNEIYKISKSLFSNFRVYKKLQKKNISISTSAEYEEEQETWENELGQRYLIYVNFAVVDEDILVNVSNFVQLNNKYSSSFPELKINFMTLMQNSEEVLGSEELGVLLEEISTFLIDDYQVFKLYTYINPYDSEISNCYLYIDLEGNVYPFDVRSETNLEEKLLSMIYPKIEIKREEYKLLKQVITKFYCEDFLSKKEYNYRYILNTILDNNKIYDENDNLTNEKFFVRGRVRIRNVDNVKEFTLLNSQDEFSILQYFIEMSKILKESLPNKDPITEIYKNYQKLNTFTIPEKSNCHICCNTLSNFNIYYCYFCNKYYCNDCEKKLKEASEDDPHYECTRHNLLAIVNYEKTRSLKNMDNIENEKFGFLGALDYRKLKLFDIGFCCSYCETTKYGNRFVCLNCRGCDLVMNSADGNSNGFVEVCGNCFEFFISYFKDPNKKQNARNMLDNLIDRDNHHFDSHLYALSRRQTGSYIYY